MGNISAGIDLIRRRQHSLLESGSSEGHESLSQSSEKDEPSPAYGLTLPLLTTSSGAKFGKSAGNAVWLSSDRCSDYQFYQFFLRCSDGEVRSYLRCLTMLSLEEVDEILREHDTNRRERVAQRALAREMVLLVRGRKALDRAEIATKILYEKRIREVTREDVLSTFGEEQSTNGKKVLVRLATKDAVGVSIGSLAASIGLVKSRGEATRAMKSGGLYVNDVPVKDPRQTVRRQHFVSGNRTLAVLSLGSKEHRILMIDEIDRSESTDHEKADKGNHPSQESASGEQEAATNDQMK